MIIDHDTHQKCGARCPGPTPKTRIAFNGSKRCIDPPHSLDNITGRQLFEGPAQRVYPRLEDPIEQRGL
jgi:hypothetical protein